MPRVFQYTKTFRKLLDGLPEARRKLALKCLEALKTVSEGKTASHGLMIKQLHAGQDWTLYEARAGIELRVLWVESKDYFCIIFVGNHDEIQKSLKFFE